MRYYQHWKSLEEKAGIWLTLCDFSANLMFGGITLDRDEALAEREFWARLNKIRQRNRLISQQTMQKLTR